MKQSNWQAFKYLLGLTASSRKPLILAAFLGFLTIGSNIGLIATAALLIASAALHPPVLDLMPAIVGVRFFGISRALCRYLERYAGHQATLQFLGELRVSFYRALEPLLPARLPDYRSGELLDRVVADVETLKDFYLRVLLPPLVALMVMAAVFIFLARFSINLALAWLVCFLVAGVALPLVLGAARGPDRRQEEVRASLNATLVDTVQGMTEILACGREQEQLQRLNTLGRELQRHQEKSASRDGLAVALTGLAGDLSLWLVLVLAIPLVTAGKLDGVFLAMLALATATSFEAISSLPAIKDYLQASLGATRRLLAVIATSTPDGVEDGHKNPRQRTPANPQPFSLQVPAGPGLSNPGLGSTRKVLPLARQTRPGHLQVKGLRFRYGQDEPPALDGIDFTLPAGGRLALVGPSGAGKSTLVNLLLRFWDYEEGSICLGGRELKDYPVEDLRRLLAVVSQPTHLFNASLAENLLLARPDAGAAELWSVLRAAGLEDFIHSLPRGLATCIGEEGLKLSGGQRQRLALARALLKNAPILILDEATSGLDAVTEQEVLQTIYQVMTGRTTLVITHHLAGLEAMDEILVLDRGRVVQRGCHEELFHQEGLYRRLWEMQQVIAP
ncbi:thiol reductant ABC exporter subunit CydC [Moorella sp. Hama-1]|uniref:thiol reductant ABC exporter subunit CydC n=1 Tax=Moorella sp. Hama-1 TaxID=2138101 RepID=UPI000D64E48A|nr:thiol reductant ABC exporter subunit CydC [Moorella sp. Hama-1]BCV22646.1 thiol reductant ABC exporter subunit CydC [Moorella sp. Hama-1]